MNRSSAPTWTFGYALFYGGLSAIMPLVLGSEYPSLVAAVGTSLLGVIVIGLGFAVYRRSRVAAWMLVAYALLDAGSRILQGHSGLLMPGLLFAFALSAAISLRKQPQLPATQN